MYTYEDLIKVGENDNEKGEFCTRAIESFRRTDEYLNAYAGACYYGKHNITMEKYQKTLRTLSGDVVPDYYSANYKLKTLMFRRLVTQQVQYVLGNGVFFQNEKTKDKLGKDFDNKIVELAKSSMACGSSFGFWNYDHLEVFSLASLNKPCFVPLYSEKDASLRAGIRYYYKAVDGNWIVKFTLFEEDGYTEYSRTGTDDIVVLQPKRPYKTKETSTQYGVDFVSGENYSKLPIIVMYANDTQESELIGIRECIDCYDFIKNGLANEIDDTSGIYWLLQNSGGMNDIDIAKFINRMKTVRGMVTDDEGAKVELKTIEVPVTARATMIELLRKDIYEDFQALDVNTLSASAKTTQEIQASYQAQDNKCADFEYCLIDFIQQLLELAGIDDEPSFKWNKIINMSEQTQTIMLASTYLDDETIIKKLPFLTPEEADEVLKRRDLEDFNQFNSSTQLSNSDLPNNLAVNDNSVGVDE